MTPAGGPVLVVGESLVDVVRRADGSVDESPAAALPTSRSRWVASARRSRW